MSGFWFSSPGSARKACVLLAVLFWASAVAVLLVGLLLVPLLPQGYSFLFGLLVVALIGLASAVSFGGAVACLQLLREEGLHRSRLALASMATRIGTNSKRRAPGGGGRTRPRRWRAER